MTQEYDEDGNAICVLFEWGSGIFVTSQEWQKNHYPNATRIATGKYETLKVLQRLREEQRDYETMGT